MEDMEEIAVLRVAIYCSQTHLIVDSSYPNILEVVEDSSSKKLPKYPQEVELSICRVKQFQYKQVNFYQTELVVFKEEEGVLAGQFLLIIPKFQLQEYP
jgi:hypothetical protein